MGFLSATGKQINNGEEVFNYFKIVTEAGRFAEMPVGISYNATDGEGSWKMLQVFA
jgi:hypothetical protein